MEKDRVEGKLMQYDLYKDIAARTKGEIYLGVVGPVRTGKSTFIKRFMELYVLPQIENEYDKKQTLDEMPQSANGITITTTEPKFIPKEAVTISPMEEVLLKVKLIDCVGFMVEGASGHLEGEKERMVKTPWFENEIPFTQAANIGTEKVIKDHATIGIVMTTDGTICDLPEQNYEDAEKKAIQTCEEIGKPYVIVINSAKPHGKEAIQKQEKMYEQYGRMAIIVNAMQLKADDIHHIFEEVLYDFSMSQLNVFLPKWTMYLEETHPCKKEMMNLCTKWMNDYTYVRDFVHNKPRYEGEYINAVRTAEMNLADGTANIYVDVDDSYYYEMLSELLQEEITDESSLMEYLSEVSKTQNEYKKILSAMETARQGGYGVVLPGKDEIILENPELIRHANKYGVKIKAHSPSIHLIRANIETEIAPIVGTEEQAKDLIDYICDAKEETEGIWETNIFGKTIEQLVNDGITNKISLIGQDSQVKLQESMQKIVNETNGGMICIII